MLKIQVDSHSVELLTTTETASILGVSVETIRRWVRLGEIKPFIHGGHKGNFFNKEEIEDLAKQNK